MSINDVKITKDERFNFMNPKKVMLKNAIIAAIALLLVIIPYELTIFAIILKIACAIIAVINIIALVLAPKNGLYVTKDGKIKLVDGAFGSLTLELNSLKRAAVNFSEWENGEFSADLKFVTEDGEIYKKEYAAKFESTMNHAGLSSYTLPREKVDEYCEKMAEMNIFNVSVINANKDIVYKYIRK
jgi:hypothetical protein